MMTLKDNTINSVSQSINSNTYSSIGYDYHQNPWQKLNYSTFDYQQTPYAMGTTSSTGGITNKSNNLYPSFDITSNLNNSTSNFYRRHTESTLPISTSIYSSSTANHPASNPFNYSHTTTTHYHPSDLFFGWNNGSSLMRTHSASYRDYPQSSSFPCYNPMISSASQPTTNIKSTDNRSSTQIPTRPMNSSTDNNYSSFINVIPPIHFHLPPLPPLTSVPSKSKRSISSRKKYPRLTAQLRNEILKLKANNPTVFVWEIQQTLLQNGICTSQTLPNAAAIQRILNKSPNPMNIIKDEPKSADNFVMQSIFNNIENTNSSSVTICLSPSQSDNESASECSVCLETYRSGQEVSILSCSHEYHSSCIKEWMIKNRSCPMCRKDIHNQPQFVTLLI